MVTGSEISFLKKKNFPSNDLLFDRKIKNGHDSRTYKVSFAKIKKAVLSVPWSVFSCVIPKAPMALIIRSIIFKVYTTCKNTYIT